MRRAAIVSSLVVACWGGTVQGCTTHHPAAPSDVPPPSPVTPAAPAPEATPEVAVPYSGSTRWVALGDSYTKGEAAAADESWPAVATARLKAKGVAIELVANLGRTGWTARDVLARQFPFLAAHPADLVTVQVGINDLVQGRSLSEFREDFRNLLSSVVKRVGSADRVIAVTIPDYSVTRTAPRFGDVAALRAEIVRRNAVIVDEGARAQVVVVDIFERSDESARDPALLADDGIHPSAAGYAAWVPEILPALEAAISKR